jgi:hypothetical protein
MRLALPVLLALSIGLSACGSSAPTATLSVKCAGSTALAGAASIDVLADAPGKGTMLSFPDPANAGQTGTIPITSGNRCTVVPVLSVEK